MGVSVQGCYFPRRKMRGGSGPASHDVGLPQSAVLHVYTCSTSLQAFIYVLPLDSIGEGPHRCTRWARGWIGKRKRR